MRKNKFETGKMELGLAFKKLTQAIKRFCKEWEDLLAPFLLGGKEIR